MLPHTITCIYICSMYTHKCTGTCTSSKIIILRCWLYCTSIPFFTVMLLICETFMRYGPSLDPLCALPVFVYALPTGMQEFSSLYPFFWPWLCWHYSDSPCFLLLWSLSSDHIPLSAVLKWIQSLKFHLLINAKCICVIKQRVDNQSHDQLFS